MVFHGTGNEKNFTAITESGFKVGGQGEVYIFHFRNYL